MQTVNEIPSFDWRSELRPRRLVANLTAGFTTGLLAVAVSISLAVLVYGGALEPFLAEGIGLMLGCTVLVGTAVALLSSLPGTAANVQDATAAVLAVAAAGIAAAMAGAAPESLYMTVAATIALTTLVAAALLLLLGSLRLGRLVRYLPYPVVGGFLAGTGWLLLIGAIGVMARVQPSGSDLAALFAPGVWIRWLPGIALAVVFVVVTDRVDHFLVWPGLLLGAVALFYLVMVASGASPEAWRARMLLLGPFPEGDLFRPFDYARLDLVRWPLVLAQAAGGATVVFLALISVLLNATGLELATGRRIDLDRELRAAGIGNLLSGLVGGAVGYQALSFSALNHRVGTGSRLASLTGVAVVVLALVFGASALAYIPTMVVGGLLAFLGLSFLLEWVVGAYAKLPRLEYATVLLILLVIAAFGFLQGVAVGVAAAVALFVVNYSRAEVVRHALSGASYQSRVSRGREARRYLTAQGDRLFILQLQGYLFFGTAHGLLDRIEARLERPPPLRFLLLDFRQVTGLDATALLSFEKLAQLSRDRDFTLVLTDLPAAVARQLTPGVAQSGRVRTFADLDAGLEWCEAELLRAAPATPRRDLPTRLAALAEGDLDAAALLDYFERLEVAPGDHLIRQGEPPDALYFLESGRLTARLEGGTGETVRLETMEGGSVVGELGFYSGGARTASVVADEASTVYRLSREALARMTRQDPRLAAAFHRLVARLIAARVGHLMTALEALQR